VNIDSIRVGDRIRKDIGDISTLAESIKRHGLLHPIVITGTDKTLVAGYRRLRAALALGWEEIPVNEIEIEDLLSAERDENEIRKDLTPTEKVDIGRLIEAQEKPKAKERIRKGAAASHENRGYFHLNEPESTAIEGVGGGKGDVVGIVSKAVDMGRNTYRRAKAVVEAAESNPEKFGDLPQAMDDTGNIYGAFSEMKRRQGNGGRHPINAKTRHMKAEPAIENAISILDGVLIALAPLDDKMFVGIDDTRRGDYGKQFISFARKISKFGRRLKNE
jgi:ParB family chromosome partitioning protein